LDNYKRVNTYCLPASLRPTLLQRFAGFCELVQTTADRTAKDNASRYRLSALSGDPKLTGPLESIIDAVLHPEIRDRMIMFRGTSFIPFIARGR